MGAVGSFKRRLLSKAYEEALKTVQTENEQTIGDFLSVYSDKLLEEVDGGKTLSSFSSNGTSSTFSISDASTIPLKSQIVVIDDLIRLYNLALAVIKDPFKHHAIYSWMLMHLQDRRCIQFEEVFHPRVEIIKPEA